MNFIYKLNLKYSYFFTISIFSLLNVNPSFLTNKIGSYEIFVFNFTRFFSLFFFLLYFFLFIYKDFKKKKIIFNLSEIKILISLFFFLFLSSILDEYNNIHNLNFLNYAGILLVAYFIFPRLSRDEILKNLYLFLFLNLIVYLTLLIYSIINNPAIISELHKAYVFSFDATLFDQPMPRSTGATKIIVITTVIGFFLMKDNIWKLLFLFLSTIFISLLNSRTGIIYYFLTFNILIIFYVENFFNKIKVLSATLLTLY